MRLIQRIKAGMRELLARHDMFYLYLRTLRCALTEGPAEAKRRYEEYVNVNHPHQYRGHLLSAEVRKSQQEAKFEKDVLISIVVPLYNTPKKYLKAMIRSVQAQTYGKWELCLADGSDGTKLGSALTDGEERDAGRNGGSEAFGAEAGGGTSASRPPLEQYCRRMARQDGRIRYQRLEKNLGISGNSNAALEMATGEYIGLLDHDDLLHPSALYEVMKVIEAQGADFIYSDEAIFQKTPKDVNRYQYKPDFSPDTLRGINYICHFTVFSRALLDRAGRGFRSEYDGSQDYDLFLRMMEKAERIAHIPRELYYWRDHAGSVASDVSVKPYTVTAGRKAIAAHLARMGMQGTVEDAPFPSAYRVRYDIQGNPKISIVIPNMDHVLDLRKCLDSIRSKSTWQNWEAIIVENNSREEETFRFYQEIEAADDRIHVVKWEKEFNFSAICNFGVSFVTGDYILLLNNDMEVITPRWMEEMLMFAQREDVGAAGCMLYYPDDTIQHAGVIVGIGSAAGHAYRWYPREKKGEVHRLCVAQNLSAVTGACMLIPRKVWDEVQGLDESFAVALNDVDLCLRIRERGYLVIFTPFAELYHYESKSRGSDESGKSRDRYEAECAKFREKWRRYFDQGDPCYNLNLTRNREDFSIRDEEERQEKG